MRDVKYISAKRGQAGIVVSVIIVHLLLVVGMYLLFFKTSIVDFDGLAVWLCSKNIIVARIRKILPIVLLVVVGFNFLYGITHVKSSNVSKSASNSRTGYVFVMNNHNSPGSHGYWW